MDIQNNWGTAHFSRKINAEARGGLPYESSTAGIYIQFPINPDDQAGEIRKNAQDAFALAKATVLDQLGVAWEWNADNTEIVETSQAPAQTPRAAAAPAPRPAAPPQAAPAPPSRAPAQQGDDVVLPAAALAQATLEPEEGGFDPYWFSEVISFGRLKGQTWAEVARACGEFGSDEGKWCYGKGKSNPALKMDGTPAPEKYILGNAVAVARARACLEYGKNSKGNAPATAVVYDNDTPF